MLCVYVIVTSTWAPVPLTVSVELTSRKWGRVDGTGIRRPELALVIHAKANPSAPPPSSLHPSISTLQWLYVDYPLATCSGKKLNRHSFFKHKHFEGHFNIWLKRKRCC